MSSHEIDLKWPIITINLVVAVDILAFMLMIPIIDVFSQHLGATKQQIGLQITIYAVSAIISSFIVGKVSDKFGRKTVFLISSLGTFITTMGCIFITTFTQFLIFSALCGLFSGTIGTAYAYIGDIVHEEKRRSRYISLVTATISCCLILGPLVGGLLASIWTLRAPFILGSIIACIEFLFVYRYLKNPNELMQSSQIRLLSKDVLSNYEYGRKESFQSDDIKSNQIFQDLNYYNRTSFSETILIDPTYTIGNNDDQKDYRFKTSSLPVVNTGSLQQEQRNPFHSESPREHEGEQLLSNPVSNMKSPADSSLDSVPPTVNTTRNNSITNNNSNSNQKPINDAKNPWKDYRALIIGGFGTFFNAFTYLGLVTLMPLILQEHQYGIVNDDDAGNNNNDDESTLSNHEVKRISLLMGLFLSCYGFTQVLGMIFVFPKLNQRIGLFNCGVIGSAIFGVAYCMILYVHHWQQIFLIYVGMAIGNSISRPIFPSYLGTIATKSNRADYMAISATFGNVSLMIAGQMTVLYTYNRDICILLCGLVSVFNALSILLFSFFHKVPQSSR
jgi:MFS family permease